MNPNPYPYPCPYPICILPRAPILTQSASCPAPLSSFFTNQDEEGAANLSLAEKRRREEAWKAKKDKLQSTNFVSPRRLLPHARPPPHTTSCPTPASRPTPPPSPRPPPAPHYLLP